MPTSDERDTPAPSQPQDDSALASAELERLKRAIEADKSGDAEMKKSSDELNAEMENLGDVAEKWSGPVEVQPLPVLPDPPQTGHSQNDEEAIIARYFSAHPPKHQRRLLDIGAWDGVNMSNSRALVEQGWDAVLVEAAAGPCVELMKNCRGFNRVRIVQALIVGQSTPMHHSRLTVLQHTRDAVSTTDPNVYAAWRPVVKDYFPIMVPTIRLSELLETFAGPFDLVTLDTEGETFSIFCDLVDRAEVSLLVVEHSAGGFSHLDQIRSIALSKGLVEISVNQENVIFGQHPLPNSDRDKLVGVF